MKLSRIEKWCMNRPQHGLMARKRADRMLTMVPGEALHGNLLELGCGNGAVSSYLAQRYPLQITGLDIDPDMIAWARQGTVHRDNLNFLEANAAKLPFPDAHFDIVLSFGVMHHIPQWLEAMAEAHRVLKPGGFFLLWDIFYCGPVAGIARCFRYSCGAPTMREIQQFLTEKSFKTLHFKQKNNGLWHSCEAIFRKFR